MDYLDFGAEDFLLDASFQEYCLGNNNEAVEFWTNWIKDHSEKSADIRTAMNLYFNLNGNVTKQDFQEDYSVFKNAFEQANAADLKIIVQPQIFHRKSNLFNKRAIINISAIAASVLLFIGIYFSFNKNSNPAKKLTVTSLIYYSPTGKKTPVTLPDGTHVLLNGNTILMVSKNYGRYTREVILDGEGYFTVIHNAKLPFMVHTRKIDIRDIGTVFNIKAYHSDRTIEASLIKGSIAISLVSAGNKKKKEIILKPNQKYVLLKNNSMMPDKDKASSSIYKINSLTPDAPGDISVAETDWTKDKLTFNNEPFEDVVLKMERWYGVKITINNQEVKQYHYTATFNHQDIEQVLDVLKLSGNFNYRKEGNTISIY